MPKRSCRLIGRFFNNLPKFCISVQQFKIFLKFLFTGIKIENGIENNENELQDVPIGNAPVDIQKPKIDNCK